MGIPVEWTGREEEEAEIYDHRRIVSTKHKREHQGHQISTVFA